MSKRQERKNLQMRLCFATFYCAVHTPMYIFRIEAQAGSYCSFSLLYFSSSTTIWTTAVPFISVCQIPCGGGHGGACHDMDCSQVSSRTPSPDILYHLLLFTSVESCHARTSSLTLLQFFVSFKCSRHTFLNPLQAFVQVCTGLTSAAISQVFLGHHRALYGTSPT